MTREKVESSGHDMRELWRWAREHVGVGSNSEIAAAIVEKDEQLVAAWMSDHRLKIVTDYVGEMERSARLTSVQHKRRAFADAAEEFEATGDAAILQPFETSLPFGIGKTVGEATGSDHRDIATHYEASGNFDLLCAKFHRAVARKVGKKRTDEVYTEDRYVQMYRSITGQGDDD